MVLGMPAAALAYNAWQREGGVQEITLVGQGSRWHPSTIQVQPGQPVRLRLVSQDVVHGFLLQGEEKDYLVYPGKVTIVQFTPTEEGTLDFVCTQYCGSGHPAMAGQIIVGEIPPTPTPEPLPPLSPLAEKGRRLTESQGCMSCHSVSGMATMAPSWRGLWGSSVTLKDGTTVTVDGPYIRESLYEPNAKVAQGYSAGIMLSYRGMLSEEAVQAIIEFIKALE